MPSALAISTRLRPARAPRARRRLLTSLTAAAAAAVVLAACGAQATSSGSGSDGVTLKIPDPGNNGVLAYAKKTGALEDALKDVGASVEWGGSYASFTATADALRAGSVNLVPGATSPVVGYLSTSDDLQIFAVAERATDPKAPVGDGLVVPADSKVKTLADLEGKKIAVNKGGRGEYLLLEALDAAGIDHDAVERVYLNPQDAAGAFASGKVDAWWAIVRGYPAAVANGARTIVANTDVDDQDLTVYAAKTDLVRDGADALGVFTDVVAELGDEAREDPDKFQNVFEDSGPRAVTGDALKHDTDVQRYEPSFRRVTSQDVTTVQNVADYFNKNGLISRTVDASEATVQLKASR